MYLAIVGIVVLIAGQAFSDSTKIRVRTQSMLKASEVAENLGGLIKDDIAQMGAKSSKEASSSEMDDFQIFSSVYIDAGNSNEHKKDSSSFTLTNQSVNCPAEGCNVQKFVFNRVHYGENGEYVSLEEVTWKLVDGVLYRGCRTKAAGSAGASVDCPVADEDDMEFVEMAAGVDAFRLIPAKPPLLSTDAKLASDMTSILPSTDPTIKEFRLVPRPLLLCRQRPGANMWNYRASLQITMLRTIDRLLKGNMQTRSLWLRRMALWETGRPFASK